MKLSIASFLLNLTYETNFIFKLLFKMYANIFIYQGKKSTITIARRGFQRNKIRVKEIVHIGHLNI